MTTKLHIDMSQGIIEVEGDVKFVREVYEDFKGILSEGSFDISSSSESKGDTKNKAPKKPDKQKPKRKAPAKKSTQSDSGDSGVSPDSPKMEKSLDTSGLPAFYGQYEPKNNPEKILIFLKFMTDELGIESPNTDQFYTCFDKMNERVPKVFSQAFRDTSGRKFGFIDYNSPTDIRITTVGTNHFKFDLKKKGDE